MEVDAFSLVKHPRRQANLKDEEHFVTRHTLVDVEAFHEHRAAQNLDVDPQFFLKLASQGGFCRFAELNAATKRANAPYPSVISTNLGSKQLPIAPMQP